MKLWSIDWLGFEWSIYTERTDRMGTDYGEFFVIFICGLYIVLDLNPLEGKKHKATMENIYILTDIADKVASRVVDEFLLQTEKRFKIPDDVRKYLANKDNPKVSTDLKSIKEFKKMLATPYVKQNGSEQFTTLEWGKVIYWGLKENKRIIKKVK